MGGTCNLQGDFMCARIFGLQSWRKRETALNLSVRGMFETEIQVTWFGYISNLAIYLPRLNTACLHKPVKKGGRGDYLPFIFLFICTNSNLQWPSVLSLHGNITRRKFFPVGKLVFPKNTTVGDIKLPRYPIRWKSFNWSLIGWQTQIHISLAEPVVVGEKRGRLQVVIFDCLHQLGVILYSSL
jgi:hypothetical protein